MVLMDIVIPSDENSIIRILNSGYEIDGSNIIDRPSSFDVGFFVDDYVFKNSGDLDVHNGRYCRTPEYPKGTYAYFVGITTISLQPNFHILLVILIDQIL